MEVHDGLERLLQIAMKQQWPEESKKFVKERFSLVSKKLLQVLERAEQSSSILWVKIEAKKRWRREPSPEWKDKDTSMKAMFYVGQSRDCRSKGQKEDKNDSMPPSLDHPD